MMAILIIYGVIALVELLLIFSFQFRFKDAGNSVSKKSKLSILVAARNEVGNLQRCLEALLVSDYDLKQVEILIGDDNSADNTSQLIKAYQEKHHSIVGIKIQEEKDGLIAKGNVLAQLVERASYDKLLIIDADMAVSKNWMSKMSDLLDEYDLVSGYTTVASLGTMDKEAVQYYDWAVVLHTMKSMGDLIQPISILGNNMAFNRVAYEEVGGFRGLGPTDVEDLGLLRQFQKFGKSSFQYIGEEGSAKTLPQLTFKEMLIQRCRWMNGVFTHHWLLGIPALFARLWFPVCMISMVFLSDLYLFILAYGIILSFIKFIQMLIKGGGAKIYHPLSPVIISLLDTFALLRLIFVGKS